MTKRKHYSAANISDDAKTMIAQRYQVQHAKGKLCREFVADMNQVGYKFSDSQLDRWVARMNTGEAAVSTSKATGASVHLTREQRDIAAGWVLSQNLHGIPVHLSDYSHFCNEQFEQMLSKQTVSRYLAEDGFSYRTMQSKAKGFMVDIQSQRRQLWDWVQIQRKEGIFDVHRSLLASIDFTFTGHRTERSSSFASQGGSQPMLGSSISPYTNCIVTVVWADGMNRTPLCSSLTIPSSAGIGTQRHGGQPWFSTVMIVSRRLVSTQNASFMSVKKRVSLDLTLLRVLRSCEFFSNTLKFQNGQLFCQILVARLSIREKYFA